MLISYLFTRPRERWFKDQIVALVFELRQKSDELVDVTSKLKEEIEVNEIAVKHNKELHAKKEELEKELEIQKQTQVSLKKTIQDLEEALEKSRLRIKELESVIELKETKILAMQGEIVKLKEEIQKGEFMLQQTKNQLGDAQIEIKRLQNLLGHAKENQRIFEYVLSKFSPELAKRLMDMKLLNPEIVASGVHERPALRDDQIAALSVPSIQSATPETSVQKPLDK